MARPHVELNLEQLRELMKWMPSLQDTAAWFGVSEDTVSRRIREWEDCTYAQFRERHAVGTRLSLVQKAIAMAMSGDRVMLIFSLKNLCGWQDRNTAEVQQATTITLAYPLDSPPAPQGSLDDDLNATA